MLWLELLLGRVLEFVGLLGLVDFGSLVGLGARRAVAGRRDSPRITPSRAGRVGAVALSASFGGFELEGLGWVELQDPMTESEYDLLSD